jgi:hypothetical protein
MGELPTQASLTAQIDCTGGGCFSFTRMGTGGGCCSFPPLLQSTVAVVRVVKTLATLDVGTWVHRKEKQKEKQKQQCRHAQKPRMRVSHDPSMADVIVGRSDNLKLEPLRDPINKIGGLASLIGHSRLIPLAMSSMIAHNYVTRFRQLSRHARSRGTLPHGQSRQRSNSFFFFCPAED